MLERQICRACTTSGDHDACPSAASLGLGVLAPGGLAYPSDRVASRPGSRDLWFFLAVQDPRISRAYLDDDTIDVGKGACALHAPPLGTAWVQTDGSITAIGEPTVADELQALIRGWVAAGQPTLTRFTATFTHHNLRHTGHLGYTAVDPTPLAPVTDIRTWLTGSLDRTGPDG